jgi:hypothetical protein
MSADSLPITPERFAAALEDLTLGGLHLKVLELRNSIAHLDYSNEQLRPFATGAEATLGSPAPEQPDQECIDAIRENEAVIARMQERIALVRAEVEARGASWDEFRSADEVETDRRPPIANGVNEHGDDEEGGGGGGDGGGGDDDNRSGEPVDGHGGAGGRGGQTHDAWTDGTLQTGTIRNGELRMDPPGSRHAGGSLADEELRRRLEEQMRGLGDDEDEEGGLHL